MVLDLVYKFQMGNLKVIEWNPNEDRMNGWTGT